MAKIIAGFIVGSIISAGAVVHAQTAPPLDAFRRVTIRVTGPFPCTSSQVLSKRVAPDPLRADGTRTFWRCVEAENAR